MKPIIPIFFATDDNYAPYLGVAIKSILENSSRKYNYKFHVLQTDLAPKHKGALRRITNGYTASVSFVDVSRQIAVLGEKLHLRDYYTRATYYRFFIADLFPQYKKALYLDCDVIVNEDISELYFTKLGNKLLAGCPEEVMRDVPVFHDYVETVLEMPCSEYFNAGVLVLNLDEFRRRNVEQEFVDLLSKRKFVLTQDQDYLNVICYGHSIILGNEWNKNPTTNPDYIVEHPKLIHYKINWKPWHYDGVRYGHYFWHYAKMTPYYRCLIKIKENYTYEERLRDQKAYLNLYRIAKHEIDNVDDSYCLKNA